MYDYAVVGGGIVGLATAYAVLRRYPRARLVLLEKEEAWARHQTGRNSGVIHSGIYYAPGSLKARYCVAGSRRLMDWCCQHEVAFERCGKVIVATEPHEIPRLDALAERGRQHGLMIRQLGADELAELEPHAVARAALHVADTGIVDFGDVARKLAALIAGQGGELRLGAQVSRLVERSDSVALDTGPEALETKFLLNCAGLQSDRVARMLGLAPPCRIVPFRGEYYRLRSPSASLVRNLIYPVPDPAFPFLGVHLTRGMDGSIHCGPNAVLALSREGYTATSMRVADVLDTVTFPPFWRFAGRHWRAAVAELQRSLSRRAFGRSLQRLVPAIGLNDLEPAAAGVRAQALGTDGRLVDDFLLVRSRRSLHVLNAPSPAATSSLLLGEAIAEQIPDYGSRSRAGLA
jgi:(S)-2-hydroxyglutarate dehydrogenase